MSEEKKTLELKSDAKMKTENLKSMLIPSPTKHIIEPEFYAYKLAIENLALSNNVSEFSNKGPIHASIVFGNIFKTAQKSVKIFTGNFSGHISDKPYYLENLRLFLTKNIPICVIFQHTPNDKSLTLSLLKEFPKNNISLWELNNHKEIFNYHFTTADRRMYRIETSPTDFEAECSFNDPSTAEALEDIFAKLLMHSDPYENS